MGELTHSTDEGMEAVERAAIARGDLDGPGESLSGIWASLFENMAEALKDEPPAQSK
jgi:hypothetical protein